MRYLARQLLPGIAAFLFLSAGANGSRAEQLLEGFWMDSDGEVVLELSACGNGRCAKVVWLKSPLGPDGHPLRDYKNSDPTLKSRPVCGLEVISGFEKQSDGTWGGGTVYVPDLGLSFSGYAEILSPKEVKVTGYVLLPIFGASEVWTRVTGPVLACSGNPANTVASQPAEKPLNSHATAAIPAH